MGGQGYISISCKDIKTFFWYRRRFLAGTLVSKVARPSGALDEHVRAGTWLLASRSNEQGFSYAQIEEVRGHEVVVAVADQLEQRPVGGHVACAQLVDEDFFCVHLVPPARQLRERGAIGGRWSRSSATWRCLCRQC